MSAEDDHEPAAEALTPGAMLAAARAAEKLSVAEAARHLKLSVVQIEALESGDFDRLPGPVFVRGFVRNYARLLKLDPDALMRRVEPELSPQAYSPETPPSKEIPFPPPAPRRWPLFAALGLVVIGVLAVHEFYWTEPIPAPPGLTAATAMPPPVAGKPAALAPAPPADSIDYSDPIPRLPVEGLTEAQQTPAPAKAAAAPVPDAPAATAGGTVVMRFDEESWIEIRDRNDKVIFSQLNPAGTEKRVRGEPPLSLVIGHAQGVQVTYNDRPVDLKPHTRVDVARIVLE